MGWVVDATLRPLHPRDSPGINCTGGWVSSRAGLDGCGYSRSTGFRSLDLRPVVSRYTDWTIPAPPRASVKLPKYTAPHPRAQYASWPPPWSILCHMDRDSFWTNVREKLPTTIFINICHKKIILLNYKKQTYLNLRPSFMFCWPCSSIYSIKEKPTWCTTYS